MQAPLTQLRCEQPEIAADCGPTPALLRDDECMEDEFYLSSPGTSLPHHGTRVVVRTGCAACVAPRRLTVAHANILRLEDMTFLSARNAMLGVAFQCPSIEQHMKNSTSQV